MPFEYFPGQTTYGGSTSYSDSASSSGSSQVNNNTGQSSNNQGGQHKLKTALEKLQSQGQGNTAQAQVYKDYLAGVVSPNQNQGAAGGPQSDKTPFSQKRKLLDDYYAGIQPTYNQSGLPSAVLDKIKGHSLYKAGMSMTPTSNMLFGYGSPFGASTGTTASSPVVQDALLNMMGQYYNKYDYNKGYYNEEGQFVPQDAIDAALANFYPEVPMYDFDAPPGTTVMGSPNYMGGQAAADLVASGHQYVEDIFAQNPLKYGGFEGSYGSGGSGGFNYGYGSSGGDGGGGGYYYDMGGGMPQTYQRAQIGPGGLQEQVNQAFLSGGKPFAKGGIVSLVED
jgi:hypothetical protein